MDRGGEGAPKGPLVTAATYSEALEAQMARSALKAHGVAAFIADEHLSTLNPHYMGAAHGIRVQVRRDDLERATEILSAHAAADAVGEEDDDDEAAAADGPKCPRCEARYAYREWSVDQVALLVVLLGLPLLFLEKRWHCRKCGAYFRGPPTAPRSGSPYRAPKRSALREEP